MPWPFASRRERLRREAADWVARLNGRHDSGDREAFEHWYGASADHARAYDRLANLFETAGKARRPAAAENPVAARRPRPRYVGYGLAAAAACAALLAFVLLSARTAPMPQAGLQVATFAASERESRRIALVDRSKVVLSPGSRLEVALGARERRLRLLKGEGSFSVAHESRPFIVAADGTEVVARGTRFVVRVGLGRTTVALIEGRVDVAYMPAPGAAGGRRFARLKPGETLVVDTGEGRPAAKQGPVRTARPPTEPAMLQFDDTPLGEAVEQVNRRGQMRVRLREPAIATLRVTGAFRAGDTAGFAQSVAAAFDLEVERAADASLLLRRRPEGRSPN